ncbi:AMP-binding protein, partial [Candidatus Bathyarchaeota archaeon]|nr:AMP-binding protein [Candidatus Bathyarchaeota archaeon]
MPNIGFLSYNPKNKGFVMKGRNQSLYTGFLNSSGAFPDRPALEVSGEILTYRQLEKRALAIASTLARMTPDDGPPLTAVFAYRSVTAFAGILGSLLRGHGYVPLNRIFPPDRTRAMLIRAGCHALIIDHESSKQIARVLDGISKPLLLLFPDHEDVSIIANEFPSHVVLGSRDINAAALWEPVPVSPDNIAYLLFTSGSTGYPKGVMVTQNNVLSFLNFIVERYGIIETDRFSQTFDMTFDLSVFDMFVAWQKGACVCCPSQKTLINPGKFIQEALISIWFSVPSTAVFMGRFGKLKPNLYPSLRWSLFCGEPLPLEVARTWAESAPNSTLENLYGPTELTIACMFYRWNPARSPQECEFGIVPIGDPFPTMESMIVDESLQEVSSGDEGELLMAGPQMSPGYWQDQEKTRKAFLIPPGKARVFYRTGDRVRRPIGDGPTVYLGRMDQQIKIHGHRVELGEIEAVL